jgi:hypothetical protein
MFKIKQNAIVIATIANLSVRRAVMGPDKFQDWFFKAEAR